MSKLDLGTSKRKPIKSLLTATFLLLVAILFFVYGFAVGKYQIPPYSLMKKMSSRINQLFKSNDIPAETEPALAEGDNPMVPILQLVREQGFTSATEEIDFIRNFIYTNSFHIIDEEFWEYSYNIPVVLEMMYDTYLNDAPPPHMVCDTRTYAMKAIVREMGFIAREVHVFSDDFDTLQSHTFLEVYNENTQMWEIQDPDFNICFVDKGTSNRLSITHLIMGDLNQITPCNASPEYSELVRNLLMDHYYEAAVILGAPEQSFILINTARFALDDPQGYFKDQDEIDNLIEYLKVNFGDYPVIIAQGFDSN